MASRPPHRRYWLVLFAAIAGAMTLSVAVTGPRPDRAHAASLRDRAEITEKFIGTWRLEDEFLQDQTGAVVGSLYQDAVGKLTYTRDGDVWAFTGERAGTAAVWYAGTFDVLRKTHTVIHHVEYASVPEWQGGDQVRRFKFDGKQRLALSVESATITAVLEWRKVSGK